MKEAVATWAPRPGRLGPIFAEPTTTPSIVATTVRPGAASSQYTRACSDVWSGGSAYVLPSSEILL